MTSSLGLSLPFECLVRSEAVIDDLLYMDATHVTLIIAETVAKEDTGMVSMAKVA
jgi:hypothetical protein